MIKEETLSQSKIIKITQDILSAIEYCHNKGLVTLNVSMDSIFFINNRFKLNSFEFCEINSEVSISSGTQGLLQKKIKDMEDFIEVVSNILGTVTKSGKLKEHIELLESIMDLRDEECSLAEFFK